MIVKVVDSNGPANVGDLICDISANGYLTVGSVWTGRTGKNVVPGWFPAYSKEVLARDGICEMATAITGASTHERLRNATTE